MIIVDTSIWIDHFSKAESHLIELLTNEMVMLHPYIIGELSCGGIKNRKQRVEDLSYLDCLGTVDEASVVDWINKKMLYGKGIGFIDVALLFSAVKNDLPIWTRDKKLQALAEKFDVKYNQK